MQCTCLHLKEYFPQLASDSADPLLYAYVPDNSNEFNAGTVRPAMVVCPGGAYRFTSDREAEPVALRFLAAGFSVFVLRYSVSPKRFPQSLLELCASIAYIRRNAKNFHVDVLKIAVCGFSAGGHLSASLANFWSESFIDTALSVSPEERKPNAVVLSYPVISSGQYAHRGSFENLLGAEAFLPQHKDLSLETSVNAQNPQTFLWHTATDESVPVQNSLLYAQALAEKNIPFEMHIYPKGVHGLSLCDESTARVDNPSLVNPHAAAWIECAITWLRLIL